MSFADQLRKRANHVNDEKKRFEESRLNEVNEQMKVSARIKANHIISSLPDKLQSASISGLYELSSIYYKDEEDQFIASYIRDWCYSQGLSTYDRSFREYDDGPTEQQLMITWDDYAGR